MLFIDLKKFLGENKFSLTQQELQDLKDVSIFIVKIYCKSLVQCSFNVQSIIPGFNVLEGLIFIFTIM